jgi:hypothetical protein
LTGSGDGTAYLWDTATGAVIHTFSGNDGSVNSVAFSPDGTKVLTGNGDGTAYLQDAATGAAIHTFNTYGVTSVAFSPDGTKVLTGSGGPWNYTGSYFAGEAKLWDASTGADIRTFSGHTGEVFSVAFSPDGTKVLTGSNDHTAELWDVATGNEIHAFLGHTNGVDSVAFSPDGTKVLTGSNDHTAKLWDAATGAEIRAFSGHASAVLSVAFSPDGAKVLTGSVDQTAKLWDTATGVEIRTFLGHTSKVDSVAFSPDGTKVLTGSNDGTARVWEAFPSHAIIVAGGGPFSGNAIAQQTKDLAAYAYKICRLRGYAANEIQYLSAFGDQDADGDGFNDVDAPATPANLQAALDTFAGDTSRLFVYMVDHGYNLSNGMYFQINPTQMVSGSQLDGWLDALQNRQTADITLVVDTCYSGRFVQECTPPVGKKRLTVASTSDNALAVFLPPPSLTSFSYQFLGALYMGSTIQQAFTAARGFFSTFQISGQEPWLDSNGNGVYEPGIDDATDGEAVQFFGSSWAYAGVGGGWEPASFDEVTPATTPVVVGGTATIYAKMLPGVIPLEVYASILPPAPETLAGDPVSDLPRLQLIRSTSDPRIWSATFDGFDRPGSYVVSHVAKFEYERLTRPVFSTLTVGASSIDRTKAILVLGRDAAGTASAQSIALANLAYRVTQHRGVDKTDIRYLSAFPNQDADGDSLNDVFAAPTASGLNSALAWASDADRLLLYMIGPSEQSGPETYLRLSAAETYSGTSLDSGLDLLQASGGPEVIAMADFPYASAFFEACQANPGQERILIASSSTDTSLLLPPPQNTSFSWEFFSAAYMGQNVKESYNAGKSFIKTFNRWDQLPWLDDNGDGIANKYDGALASATYWGYPVAFAGPEGADLPFIIGVASPQNIGNGSTAGIWADLIEGPVPVAVEVKLLPPNVAYTPGEPVVSLQDLNLTRVGATWRWSANLAGLAQLGDYTILYRARYANDQYSTAALGSVTKGPGNTPDAYEVDNTLAQASPFYIGGPTQNHTIHISLDEDWVFFEAIESKPYLIEITNVGADLDIAFDVFDASGQSLLPTPIDDTLDGQDESYTFIAPIYGRYYVRVFNAGSSAPTDPGYSLSIAQQTGLNNGLAVPIAGGLRLSWSPSIGRTLTGFAIQRSQSPAGPYITVANLPPDATTTDDLSLTPLTTYFYMIYEYDESLNAGQLTSPFSGTTLAGPAPTPTQTQTPTPTLTPTPGPLWVEDWAQY